MADHVVPPARSGLWLDLRWAWECLLNYITVWHTHRSQREGERAQGGRRRTVPSTPRDSLGPTSKSPPTFFSVSSLFLPSFVFFPLLSFFLSFKQIHCFLRGLFSEKGFQATVNNGTVFFFCFFYPPAVSFLTNDFIPPCPRIHIHSAR